MKKGDVIWAKVPLESAGVKTKKFRRVRITAIQNKGTGNISFTPVCPQRSYHYTVPRYDTTTDRNFAIAHNEIIDRHLDKARADETANMLGRRIRRSGSAVMSYNMTREQIARKYGFVIIK